MKRFIQHTILLIAAFAVFTTGSGATMLNYCCNSCFVQTLSGHPNNCCKQSFNNKLDKSALADSCCSSSLAKQQRNNHDDCNNPSQKGNQQHCKAYRVSPDIDHASSRIQLLPTYIWTVVLTPLTDLYAKMPNTVEAYTLRKVEPPEKIPRQYLSFIRILII